MLAHLQQELVEKEETLEKLQETVQENQKSIPPSISTTSTNTMIETTSISSPSFDFSPEHFGEFEKHTRGISSNILRKMGYDGHGLGKRRQGILCPTVVASWVKNEGYVLMEELKNPMTTRPFS
jgi:hypothetical protein